MLHLDAALTLLDRADDAAAADVLAALADETPVHATVHVLLAQACERLHRWDEALAAWQTARLLLPDLVVVQQGTLRAAQVLAALQTLRAPEPFPGDFDAWSSDTAPWSPPDDTALAPWPPAADAPAPTEFAADPVWPVGLSSPVDVEASPSAPAAPPVAPEPSVFFDPLADAIHARPLETHGPPASSPASAGPASALPPEPFRSAPVPPFAAAPWQAPAPSPTPDAPVAPMVWTPEPPAGPEALPQSDASWRDAPAGAPAMPEAGAAPGGFPHPMPSPSPGTLPAMAVEPVPEAGMGEGMPPRDPFAPASDASAADVWGPRPSGRHAAPAWALPPSAPSWPEPPSSPLASAPDPVADPTAWAHLLAAEPDDEGAAPLWDPPPVPAATAPAPPVAAPTVDAPSAYEPPPRWAEAPDSRAPVSPADPTLLPPAVPDQPLRGIPSTFDLDDLIESLSTAGRIVPLDDPSAVAPPPGLDTDDADEVVSPTLARIFAAQGQFADAIRAYERLAATTADPARAADFRAEADALRTRAR